MQEYDYVHLEKFERATEMFRVCRKILTEYEIFNLLPKIDAFNFSMSGGCPIFRVTLKDEDEWTDMLTLGLRL